MRAPARAARPSAHEADSGGDEGYTLVEVTVAVVLLVVVLVPTVFAAVALTRSPDARLRSEAASIAQAELERALVAPDITARTQDDGPWRIVRTVEDLTEATVSVRVEVSRGQSAPLASVETVRYRPSAPDALPTEARE